MVVVFVLELEAVELLDEVGDGWLDRCHLFVALVADGHLVHLLLVELHHQRCVLVRPLIEERDGVQVYCLVEHHVLDLALGLADHVAQLVVVEEEELEFGTLVLHELQVVRPVCVLFGADFYHGAEGFAADPVPHLEEGVLHEDLGVLPLADEGHGGDGHEGVGDGVVDHEVFDVPGGLAGLDLPPPLFLHRLEKHLAAHLLRILLALPESLNRQDHFAHLVPLHVVQRRFNVVAVEAAEVRKVHLRGEDEVQVGVIEILVLAEDLDFDEVGGVVVNVGEWLGEGELVGGEKGAALLGGEEFLADLDSEPALVLYHLLALLVLAYLLRL